MSAEMIRDLLKIDKSPLFFNTSVICALNPELTGTPIEIEDSSASKSTDLL